jgi:hypothetical protein
MLEDKIIPLGHEETWRSNDITQFMLAAIMVKSGITLQWINQNMTTIEELLSHRDQIPGGPE